ncbi:DNA-binding LacI/PurR family transcriptional regulator [Puniceicoccus vermicola]|uniref:LacI family DNA-binding transcriptional regulator n=2 Tax=Puniceicoccus vermicola TaxID=388746 RepID=A0A7X1AZ88_9BACT|nr:LacI family DNA-binding transcriptional regulator [Puniceicoccus vermicola]MBC2602710.1 LacI family DNA-binding transcriptional regulator [Puniceicoccus vermicola]
MADVARKAGVHRSTVSRSLKNDPRISDKIKKHVQETAEEMGYRPNPLISALGALRTHHNRITLPLTLGYIQRGNRPLLEQFRGAVEMANHNGYKVEEFRINEKMSADRLNKILVNRNIRGLILAPLPEAHGSFSLDWERFATVTMEYSFTSPRFDRIVPDSFQSVIQIMDQCMALGHSRIGLLLTRTVHERNERLLTAAYRQYTQENHPTSALPPLIVESSDQTEQLKDWIITQRPQVVISSNHLIPEVETCLSELEIKVPEEIGIINLNTFPESQKYTGTSLDARMMGAQSVAQLIHKLNNNQYGIPSSRITIQMDIEWIEGQTLLPASKMSSPRIHVKSPQQHSPRVRAK